MFYYNESRCRIFLEEYRDSSKSNLATRLDRLIDDNENFIMFR